MLPYIQITHTYYIWNRLLFNALFDTKNSIFFNDLHNYTSVKKSLIYRTLKKKNI